MNLFLRMYRLLLGLYPAEFRERYADEMALAAEQSLRDARSRGLAMLRLLADLLRSLVRENCAGTAGLAFSALASGSFLVWVDRGANEVQALMFVLLSLAFVFGAASPRRAVFWSVVLGLSIPIGHLVFSLLRVEPLPRGAMFGAVLVIPALVGAYCGVGLRRMAETPSGTELTAVAAGLGVLIGFADFTLITPVPALVGVALSGLIMGYFGRRPWAAAFCLGFAVPVAVTLCMALRMHPTRHHFVFLEARYAVLAVAACGLGVGLRKAASRIGTTPFTEPVARLCGSEQI